VYFGNFALVFESEACTGTINNFYALHLRQ